MDCLQNWHIGPNLSYLTESGINALFEFAASTVGKSNMVGLFAFVASYISLLDYLAQILSGALFLGLLRAVWVTR